MQTGAHLCPRLTLHAQPTVHRLTQDDNLTLPALPVIEVIFTQSSI